MHQISVETAQSHLDTTILEPLKDKAIILGVLDLSDPSVETAETVAERIRFAASYQPWNADRPPQYVH